MTSRLHPLVFVICCLAGCQGDGAAVSVRWRIVDLSTGQSWDANDKSINAAGGVCCRADLDKVGHTCVDSIWEIDQVRVDLFDSTTGMMIPLAEQPVSACAKRELTSRFNLPLGSFAITLEADPPDGGAPVYTPAPQVRALQRGSIANLNVIEIGVDPLPHPSIPDGGAVP